MSICTIASVARVLCVSASLATAGAWAATDVLDPQGNAMAPVAEALPLDPESTTRLGLYATPAQAHRAQLGQGARVLLVDVRSAAERRRSGVTTATGLWLPLLPDTSAESGLPFVAAVEAALQALSRGRATAIFVVCGNGRTAAAAVDVLAGAGYRNVILVIGGLAGEVEDGRPGWLAAGLPVRRIGL